jgi:hypothetical protein
MDHLLLIGAARIGGPRLAITWIAQDIVMKRLLTYSIFAATSLVLALASAQAGTRVKASAKATHARHVKVARVATGVSSQDQPRMIEIRPGTWISSWECFTDEGNGRLRACSAGDGIP